MLGDVKAKQCRVGDVISVVGQGNNGADSSSIISLWTGELFVLPSFSLEYGVWSLINFRVLQIAENAVHLEATKDSQVFQRPMRTARGFRDLVEVCCGLGGIAVGAAAAGGHALLSVDRSALACATVLANQGCPLQGDISDPSVQAAICSQVGGREVVLTAGFPCQPYSIMGSQRGLKDARGLTLLSVLQVAWRLQANALLLACVAEVADHAATMQVLADFASKAGYRVATTVLDLAAQWPSRRRRWWAVLTPCELPPLHLRTWSTDPAFARIRQVISSWPSWPLLEEEDLR